MHLQRLAAVCRRGGSRAVVDAFASLVLGEELLALVPAHGSNSAACYQDDQEDHWHRIVGAAVAGVAALAEAGPTGTDAVRSAVHAKAAVVVLAAVAGVGFALAAAGPSRAAAVRSAVDAKAAVVVLAAVAGVGSAVLAEAGPPRAAAVRSAVDKGARVCQECTAKRAG